MNKFTASADRIQTLFIQRVLYNRTDSHKEIHMLIYSKDFFFHFSTGHLSIPPPYPNLVRLLRIIQRLSFRVLSVVNISYNQPGVTFKMWRAWNCLYIYTHLFFPLFLFVMTKRRRPASELSSGSSWLDEGEPENLTRRRRKKKEKTATVDLLWLCSTDWRRPSYWDWSSSSAIWQPPEPA